MLNHLSAISKDYGDMLIIKLCLIITTFFTFSLLTLLIGALMLIEWHVHIADIFLVCLLPWIFAMVTFKVMMEGRRTHIQQERRQVYEAVRNNIFYQTISFAAMFFVNKKR